MDFETEAVVIGAGVVGLAIGRALARRGLETVVLERGPVAGGETSSRNSEVIHAGIYYPPGSVKARTCVKGKALLYAYLESHKIPHARCGKLVVAPGSGDHAALERINERARQCGVTDLQWLGAEELRQLEPGVEGACGLLSPSTGIVDAHQLMLSLQGDLEGAGGVLALASPLLGAQHDSSGLHCLRVGGADPMTIGCPYVINASGLWASETWSLLMHDQVAPPQFYAKGHYYAYTGESPFSRLVYPLPEHGGLGIHATLDLGGQTRFGPDVRWVSSVDYHFDDSRRDEFVAAISRYFPELEAERLQPAYTGIRPKIVDAGDPAGDFSLLSEAEHGVPGVVSLHGIESPGLTACLAIAERVVALCVGD